MKINFIADHFVEQVLGGGELNNEEFIKVCVSNGHDVKKNNSHLIDVDYLKSNLNSKFVIGNFVNLSENCKDFLTEHAEYVIYEHDHKYIKNRNPAVYDNFIAPKNMIVNFELYKNSKAVLCQSGFHAKILEKNLKTGNIVNLSGNLWSLQSIEKMRELSKEDKLDKYSIMNSNIPHKNTADAIRYCRAKGLEFELINMCSYFDFLERLSKNEKFLFLPKTPETLSRIVVEARMMGIKVTTNNLVGATGEGWFKFKGAELVDIMVDKRIEIPDKILGFFENA